tara:strand:+ start:1587 stop:2351 length:765 start_codon:yes stop_codon:yes gene_type:complete
MLIIIAFILVLIGIGLLLYSFFNFQFDSLTKSGLAMIIISLVLAALSDFQLKAKKEKELKDRKKRRDKEIAERKKEQSLLIKQINKEKKNFKNNVGPKIDEIESEILSKKYSDELNKKLKKHFSNYRKKLKKGMSVYYDYCLKNEEFQSINDFPSSKYFFGDLTDDSYWNDLRRINKGTAKSLSQIISEIKWHEEKISIKENILKFLKKEKTKLPASDIDFQLKIGNIDLVKALCEQMYRDKKIGRTGNYRYFV